MAEPSLRGPLSTEAGAAAYSPLLLRSYNVIVHRLFNTIAWGCPVRALHAMYDQHVSGAHLDVGIGTGYFLDKCRFPSANPMLALMDLNPNTLRFAGSKLRRYQPRTYEADILRPINVDAGRFQSIGLMYLLHCLPGNLRTKAVAFDYLQPYLAADGVVFGGTILVKGVHHNPAGRFLLQRFNASGIFGNMEDSLDDLQRVLDKRFSQVKIELHGRVALFAATQLK